VVKAGGELLKQPRDREKLLSDLAKLSKREAVVLIHGGGPQIEAGLKKERIPNRFIGGRRFTSDRAMAVVEKILERSVNKELAADLLKKGVKAVGFSGRDGGMVIGRPIPGLGRAGQVKKVRVEFLRTLLGEGLLPVICSVGMDKEAKSLNINADDFASAVALALKARHLVFLTDVEGVMGSRGHRIPVLKTGGAKGLIDSKVISGGMVPKIQAALLAIRKGVGEVDILKGGKGIQLASGTRIIK